MTNPTQHQNSNGQRLTLVTGGTGKTGGRVMQRLTARDVPVRVGSRTGEPPFDWSDSRTWAAALSDVEAVYLAYLPDIGAPRAADDIAAFCALAISMGVRRAVLLSGRNEPMAQRCEDVVRAHPWEWTVVRSSVFSQNFSEAFWLEPVRSGVIVVPAGNVTEPFVDADDVADVAVAALIEEGHVGQVYELSGPRSIAFAEVAAEITTILGRPVLYEPVTTEQFTAALTADGVPGDEASFVADLFTALFDGRNAATTDGVRRALGRAPREFHDYVENAARSGVWDIEPGR